MRKQSPIRIDVLKRKKPQSGLEFNIQYTHRAKKHNIFKVKSRNSNQRKQYRWTPFCGDPTKTQISRTQFKPTSASALITIDWAQNSQHPMTHINTHKNAPRSTAILPTSSARMWWLPHTSRCNWNMAMPDATAKPVKKDVARTRNMAPASHHNTPQPNTTQPYPTSRLHLLLPPYNSPVLITHMPTPRDAMSSWLITSTPTSPNSSSPMIDPKLPIFCAIAGTMPWSQHLRSAIGPCSYDRVLSSPVPRY